MPTTLEEALDLINRGGTLLILIILSVSFLQGRLVSGDAHKQELANKDAQHARELADRDEQIKQLNTRLDSAYAARDRAMDLAVFGANMTKDSVNLTHSIIRGVSVDGAAGPEVPTDGTVSRTT